MHLRLKCKKYIYSNHNIVNSLDIYKKTNLEKQKGQKNRSAYHQIDACHGSDIIDIIIPTAAKVKTPSYKNNAKTCKATTKEKEQSHQKTSATLFKKQSEFFYIPWFELQRLSD